MEKRLEQVFAVGVFVWVGALCGVALWSVVAAVQPKRVPVLVVAPKELPDVAPLYSSRCARQDADFIAQRADNGHWKVYCLKAGVLVGVELAELTPPL